MIRASGLLGGAGALLSLSWGCSADGAQQNPDAEGSPCPECQVAGGETSDFGSHIDPTPCEKSEVGELVDETTARGLGFGVALDLYERSFESPFRWTSNESANQEAATGYQETTSVAIETHPTLFEHRVPALAGCEDRLLVTLDVSFQTADGALAVAGQVVARASRAATSAAFGRLDLSSALGSLRLFPPSNVPAPRVGYLTAAFNFWPDVVRGDVAVEVMQAGTESYDNRPVYRPLDGKFPIDSCFAFQRPLAPTEPSTILSGKSGIELRDEWMARLGAGQPALGTWTSGATTEVTVELGAPTNICVAPNGAEYEIPLKITSSDGRVKIDGNGRGHAGVAVGIPNDVWFGIGRREALSAADFEAGSGISGVDFAGVPGAVWRTQIYLQNADATPARGSLTVEGVDVQGTLTGTPGAVTGVVEELSWPLE